MAGGAPGPVPQERGTVEGVPSPGRRRARSDQTVSLGTTDETPAEPFSFQNQGKSPRETSVDKGQLSIFGESPVMIARRFSNNIISDTGNNHIFTGIKMHGILAIIILLPAASCQLGKSTLCSFYSASPFLPHLRAFLFEGEHPGEV